MISKLEQINEQAFRTKSVNSSISLKDCQDIMAIMERENRAKLRINFHQNYSDPVQRMLIFFDKTVSLGPFYQENGHISYSFIHGSALLKFFHEDLRVKETAVISRHNPVINFPAKTIREITITSDFFVFFEVADGPFLDSNTKWIDK